MLCAANPGRPGRDIDLPRAIDFAVTMSIIRMSGIGIFSAGRHERPTDLLPIPRQTQRIQLVVLMKAGRPHPIVVCGLHVEDARK